MAYEVKENTIWQSAGHLPTFRDVILTEIGIFSKNAAGSLTKTGCYSITYATQLKHVSY